MTTIRTRVDALPAVAADEIATDSWIRAYAAPFPTPALATGAIGWAKGVATNAHQFETASARTMILQKPALAIWGQQDRSLNAEHFLPMFTQLFPTVPVRRLPKVGHYSPEDAPADIAQLVMDFPNVTWKAEKES